jgi:hypothetical protein
MKLVVSPKFILGEFSTPSFGFALPAAAHSSLNQALLESDIADFLNPVSWNVIQFCSLCGYTQIGDETGIRGSNYGLKTG